MPLNDFILSNIPRIEEFFKTMEVFYQWAHLMTFLGELSRYFGYQTYLFDYRFHSFICGNYSHKSE